MAETMSQFLTNDPPPAFVLAENKNHDTLVDVANNLTRAVPGLAQDEPLEAANLFLCVLEQAYWRGYQDGKQVIEFRIGDTS